MSGPEVLTLDIETAPAKVFTFETRNVNIGINQIIEPVRMISFAAKWRGKSKVHFYSEHHHGRAVMVCAARDLLHEADVVVTYNGDNFDLPHISREIDLFNLDAEPGAKLGDPSPYVSVDLYKVIKREQRWMSHKLAYITEQLALTGKMSHEGFGLWVACMNGDDKAWSQMRRYNKQDVVTTEELFEHCLPKIKNLPSAELWQDERSDRPTCPTCGSEHVTRQGYKRTRTRRYPRYQCSDCGSWFRDTRSEMGGGTT